MRRLLVSVAAAAVVAGGVIAGPLAGASGATRRPATRAVEASLSASGGCSSSAIGKEVFQKGVLTVATDSPAYTPWFVGNKPSNGKGFESAVAYAVAKQLGFGPSKVRWVVEPFDASYAPGPKKFDFDINEISYSAARAKAVTFSVGYYDVTQALIALKGSPIVKHHDPAALRTYLYGDQIGTTSLAFIDGQIRPSKTPSVLNTLDDVKTALETHRIDAFVTDTPTAQYMASSEIPHAVVVGQFPTSTEHFGLLFSRGNPLVSCVDGALTKLKRDGTLASLQRRWLGLYNSIPKIEP